eukprot:4403573-Lingulodinium_polyedra.AAC.1
MDSALLYSGICSSTICAKKGADSGLLGSNMELPDQAWPICSRKKRPLQPTLVHSRPLQTTPNHSRPLQTTP